MGQIPDVSDSTAYPAFATKEALIQAVSDPSVYERNPMELIYKMCNTDFSGLSDAATTGQTMLDLVFSENTGEPGRL